MKDLTNEEKEQLLKNVGDGVLALSHDDTPYCIPFGFVYISGVVYLSLFPKGRKWGILQKNTKVCFTIFSWNEDHTEWSSVVVDGKIVPVDDLKEIESVVKANMEKMGLDPTTYLEKRMTMYKKTMDNSSALKIFKIESTQVSGKKMKMLIGS